MRILHVVGARPNFMKVAPVFRAFQDKGVGQLLVHTGQHYDVNMSDVFFHDLGLPVPDLNLHVGSGSHAQQTAKIIAEFEPTVIEHKPDFVMVYGDVNSTLAAALVCAKLGVKICHVEAGLRSFERSMPEEINRIVTDQLCDLLFTPSVDGNRHLLREGIADSKIHFVGNVMIDTLVSLVQKAKAQVQSVRSRLSLKGRFGLVTLHRPANVDTDQKLKDLVSSMAELSRHLRLLFPVHPRTWQRIQDINIQVPDTLTLCEPLSYLDFLTLQSEATVVITDSGGIQEETTFLGVPCITMRENTERPITVEVGTNVLIGSDIGSLRRHFHDAIEGRWKSGAIPPLWDGHASERIAKVVCGA